MRFRFLIDECLSPELARLAVDAGHVESTCVRNRGLSGTKDWRLIDHVVRGDFTLVTNNAVDFRGGGPGRLGGEHARQPLHAGLVRLSSELPMDLNRQFDLFQIALDELAVRKDLINQALEVIERKNGRVEVFDYDIPSAS